MKQRVQWLEPWRPIPPTGHGSHEAELRREVGPQHPLHDARVTAVAERGDEDDVLFELDEGRGGYVLVRLTWSGWQEPHPHPAFRSYATFDDWVEDGMKRDHAAWARRMSNTLCMAAEGLDEVSAMVAIMGIGMCRAVSAGTISPAYACRRLFGPALLVRLERLGASGELRDAIHAATEFEDIHRLVPGALPEAIARVEAALVAVLSRLTVDEVGEKWLVREGA